MLATPTQGEEDKLFETVMTNAQYADEHRNKTRHAVKLFAQKVGITKRGNGIVIRWYKCDDCEFKTPEDTRIVNR